MIMGVVILSAGISIFRQSGMGNDPCNAMLFRMAEITQLSFSRTLILANVIYFALEFLLGRKYVGIGTFVNWFGCAYIISFFCSVLNRVFQTPDTLGEQILWIVVGVMVISLGISLYQTADLGVAPYDSLALLIFDRTRLPYFLCRILLDGLCAVICWQMGGSLGAGTVICAFGLGTFISFFNKYISIPLCTAASQKRDRSMQNFFRERKI